MTAAVGPLPLHPGPDHGGAPELFSPEWIRADAVPFLVVFLAVGVGGGALLFAALYGYDRLRFDHPTPVSRAFSVLWVALYLLVVGVAVGGIWDKAYHANRGFETFYAAPHLFVYGAAGTATLLVVVLIARYARLFGPATDLPFGVPGSLGLLVVGLAVMGFGGAVLDNAWHTLFGLNETDFSAPHMMIRWGLVLGLLGFAATLRSLSRHRTASGRYRVLVAYVLLVFSITPVMGSFGKHHTLEHLRAIMALPAVEGTGLRRAFTVMEAWHLVRTNPVAVVLGGVWAGGVVGFLERYLGRARAVVGLVCAFTLLRASSNLRSAGGLGIPVDGPAVWLPLPLIVAVVAVAVGTRSGLDDGTVSVLAGGAFALVTALVWSPTALGVVLAAPVATLAFVRTRRLGGTVHELVRHPTGARLRRAGTVAVGVPLATGVVDLLLRVTTGTVVG